MDCVNARIIALMQSLVRCVSFESIGRLCHDALSFDLLQAMMKGRGGGGPGPWRENLGNKKFISAHPY